MLSWSTVYTWFRPGSHTPPQSLHTKFDTGLLMLNCQQEMRVLGKSPRLLNLCVYFLWWVNLAGKHTHYTLFFYPLILPLEHVQYKHRTFLLYFTTLVFLSQPVIRDTHPHTHTHTLRGSGVLRWEVTLLLQCKTALEAIDSFSLLLVNNMIIEENRVQPPPQRGCTTYRQGRISCVTYGTLSGLSTDLCNSCLLCCQMGSPELPEITWAVDKQPDDIWSDLQQHITFSFPDTPWPMSHQGPPLPLSLLWSWQVSSCWQWPLKCSLLGSHAVQEQGLLASPPRMFSFCSK